MAHDLTVDQILGNIESEHSGSRTTNRMPEIPRVTQTKKKLPNVETDVGGVVFYQPRGRLPDDIEGKLLIGEFAAYGEDESGGMLMVASGDKKKTFARIYHVRNLNTGLPAGGFFSDNKQQDKLISFTRDHPLVFIVKNSTPFASHLRCGSCSRRF